jgi:pilus assembly protein CpaD
MQTIRRLTTGRRGVAALAARSAIAIGCALFLCSCNSDQQITGTPDVSPDYRLRHPITLQESSHAMEIFIGTNRGELNPTQRAEVLSFGLGWKREATGGIVVDRPVGSSNERASSDAMREVLSILAASGMPANSVVLRTYPATGPNLATVRLSYPKISAQAGPCGLWPRDIGPTMNREFFENQPPWNAGCATQHNLAAMIDNPADLVQPRGETAASTARRTVVLEKYRQGQDPSTQASTGASSAKISDIAK